MKNAVPWQSRAGGTGGKLYPPFHERPVPVLGFDRLDMLWKRYPHYHKSEPFSTLEALLEEHESYRKDFEDVREEYEANHYE